MYVDVLLDKKLYPNVGSRTTQLGNTGLKHEHSYLKLKKSLRKLLCTKYVRRTDF